MIAVPLGGKDILALAFAPAGDALFAAAGRVLFRLAWPGGRLTHTSYHIPRRDRPRFGRGLVATADGRAAADGQWWEPAGDRLMPVGPCGLPPDAVPVVHSAPPLTVVCARDGRPWHGLPWRCRLVGPDGPAGELPYRQHVLAAWQEDERTLLVRGSGTLYRYRLSEQPRGLWGRLTGEPARLRWRVAAERRLPTGVGAVARYPAGRWLLLGVGDEVVEWDHHTGQERRRWRLGRGHLSSLAVAPDGLTAAAGGRGVVVAFDLE